MLFYTYRTVYITGHWWLSCPFSIFKHKLYSIVIFGATFLPPAFVSLIFFQSMFVCPNVCPTMTLVRLSHLANLYIKYFLCSSGPLFNLFFVWPILCLTHPLSHPSFVLPILCLTHSLSDPSFVRPILCPTHPLSDPSFVRPILCPTHPLSNPSFVWPLIWRGWEEHFLRLEKTCVILLLNQNGNKKIDFDCNTVLITFSIWWSSRIGRCREL